MKPECIVKVINNPAFRQLPEPIKDLIVESISDVSKEEIAEIFENFENRIKDEYTDMGDSLTEAGKKAKEISVSAKSNLTMMLENFTLKKQKNKTTQRLDEDKMSKYLSMSGGK